MGYVKNFAHELLPPCISLSIKVPVTVIEENHPAPIAFPVSDNDAVTGTFAPAFPRDSFLEQAPSQGTFNMPYDNILSG
jgi:hypothetical protein